MKSEREVKEIVQQNKSESLRLRVLLLKPFELGTLNTWFVTFQAAGVRFASVATQSCYPTSRESALCSRKHGWSLPKPGSANSLKPRAVNGANSIAQLSTAFQFRTPLLNSTKLGSYPLTLFISLLYLVSLSGKLFHSRNQIYVYTYGYAYVILLW